MRKTPLGGLVSSLAFVLACEDSTGPQQAGREKLDPEAGSAPAAVPQIVEFDPETGRMTILDQNLSNPLRDFYGVKPGNAGSGEAIIVFVGSASKTGQDGDAVEGGDTIVNLRC